MAGFAIDTGADVFGVITALQLDTANAGVYKVENWSKTPHALNSAYAEDSNGDPAAASYYGGTGGLGGAAFDYSYDIVLVSGSAQLSGITLGAKGTGLVMGKVDVVTSNGAWPKITVSGRDQVAATDTVAMGTWTLPTALISGRKKAQAIGFTIAAGCRLQGASVAVSTDDSQQLDSQGAEAAYDISNGILTGSADLVEVTTACSWTMDSVVAGVVTQSPGSDQTNTGYATTSGTYEKILNRT
jgi:hypothetical protein